MLNLLKRMRTLFYVNFFLFVCIVFLHFKNKVFWVKLITPTFLLQASSPMKF